MRASSRTSNETQARIEALCANKAALRTQFNRICETIGRLLQDKTLAERIRTLFREQGITIASILTAIGMAISILVLALTGGGSAPVPSPTPRPPDKGSRGQGVGKKAPTGPRACPGQFGRQGRCGPARNHRLNRLLAPGHVSEGRDFAR